MVWRGKTCCLSCAPAPPPPHNASTWGTGAHAWPVLPPRSCRLLAKQGAASGRIILQSSHIGTIWAFWLDGNASCRTGLARCEAGATPQAAANTCCTQSPLISLLVGPACPLWGAACPPTGGLLLPSGGLPACPLLQPSHHHQRRDLLLHPSSLHALIHCIRGAAQALPLAGWLQG